MMVKGRGRVFPIRQLYKLSQPKVMKHNLPDANEAFLPIALSRYIHCAIFYTAVML
jgi:hypothetical protein